MCMPAMFPSYAALASPNLPYYRYYPIAVVLEEATGASGTITLQQLRLCHSSSLGPLGHMHRGSVLRRSFSTLGKREVALRHLSNGPGSTIRQSVNQATDLLPHQGILANFVHQNPLERLEHLPFQDAVDYVQRMENYMSPGARAFAKSSVDPRKRVNKALADLSSAFLDRGAAKWLPPYRNEGFLHFFAHLESLGLAPWRRHARSESTRVLRGETNAYMLLQQHLAYFGVPDEDHELALRAMMLELRGWAGMFHRMETHPLEAPANAAVRLSDFCAVQAILTRSSIDSLRVSLTGPPVFRVAEHGSRWHSSAIASADQSAEKRVVLETDFENRILYTLGLEIPSAPLQCTSGRPAVQMYACIDDRSGSLRRYMEEALQGDIETFGVVGAFGLPVQQEDPVEIGPKQRESIFPSGPRQLLAHMSGLWERASFSPLGSLVLTLAAPVAMARLVLMGYAPTVLHSMKTLFLAKPTHATELRLPFSCEAAATSLAGTLKTIGAHRCFALLVFVLGHRSSSVNNPFRAAYQCGACGGREGGPNARLLARMANDPGVRMHLLRDHGIRIPNDTVFVGGAHNTTTDVVTFYDEADIPASHRHAFEKSCSALSSALGRNAMERCRLFLLAQHVITPEQALRHVFRRSCDPAEVRPELNHATNATVIIGRRQLTQGRFLDRRAFLPSYDPFLDDDAGTNLEKVLGPALVVCSGINLEYLFSTIDEAHHGAGTKAPHNVVGLVGVSQGTNGDLLAGLPTQMTEMHLPVRALFVVDAPVRRVEAVLSRRPELKQLVRNQWVRLFVRDPEAGVFWREDGGRYSEVDLRGHVSKTPFERNRMVDARVSRRETLIYRASTAAMLLSCGIPTWLHAADMLNPYGAAIALSGTVLALPVLAFSRRYLHGEHIFGRVASLSSAVVLGFSMVATAPSLTVVMEGWSLFGFASAFLIGAYNDRPTVRDNASYAFSAYKISDLAMLTAAAFTVPTTQHPEIAAGALLLAAMFKSSQFPLTPLFVRSMEGPTPASALGYAGLSAHVGVVLLTSTMDVWCPFDWARVALGSVGLTTAMHASLVSKTRADRKGALANATSATLGGIYMLLAAGYPEAALVASLGHAAFRINQVLLSSSTLSDWEKVGGVDKAAMQQKAVPAWLYRASWALRRFDEDFHLIHTLHSLSAKYLPPRRKLNKAQQWAYTAAGVTLAGAPFTAVSYLTEHSLMALLPQHPYLAASLMLIDFSISVLTVRWVLTKVLNNETRFRKQ